uniref:DUF659 domain-containing protein n=1 Tax=Rhizophagus irregularis (strain DAOM 181602 / DAOM 197198 / MUCL 43194) TaxID=747089 RepID=U9USP8_RHIID
MSERQEILSRKVPEDEKKNKGTPILDNEKSVETAKFTNTVPSTSSVIKQTTLSRYVSCPLSKKDNHHFENLILLMMVSNGLSFTFLKNKETQEVFRFIAPALKLPGRHAISNRILSKSAKQLTQSIVEQAKADVIGVTAAFNGWTNVKQEHLFGVVFITSSGKTLIWGLKTLAINGLKLMILMNNAELKQIKINCYVSDSAGEYAVARRQLRIEYPNKVIFLRNHFKQVSKNAVRVTLITKCSSERIGTPKDDDENNDDSEFTFNAFNDSDTEKLEETSIINDYSREVEPYDFEVGGHDTQPVPLAKCKLLELFNDSLEASIYMI